MFDISRLEKITGSILFKFSSLKKLYVNECKNLKDDHLISFIRCADALDLLKIYICEKITDSVVIAAVEITKMRTNNVILDIQIESEKINFKKINGKSPLLHLSMD